MAAKKRKPAKRAPRRGSAARTARDRSADDVVDVTDDPADAVIGQVKLLCDNDTEVVFTRAGARLMMRLQERR